MNSNCWLYAGNISSHGYGRIGQEYAHRLVYEQQHGVRLSREQHIDHLCRITQCINPTHLEAVTRKENILRGVGIAAQQARKTHCKYGHSLTKDNLYKTQLNKRICAECGRRNSRNYQLKKKLVK